MRHNRIEKRLLVVAAALVAVGVIIAAVFLYRAALEGSGRSSPESGNRKETIHLWYTDDALTDYLNSKALEFYDSTDIRVNVKLVSGLEYLEAVNAATLDEAADAPDLYILSNDSLEKAYLAGLAAQLPDTAPVYEEEMFSQAARNAVTYNGKYVACPMYFETSALLYNKTYLQQIADEANGAGGEEEEGSAAASEEQPGETAAEQTVTAEQLIPTSIVDILTFADQYSTPENVEYFFRWDVSDIFYNYFFIGNYISVGGAAGDDKSLIDIYNTESISSLKVYQEMNQFFSIDTKETNYDTVMREFREGKTIYTIATSDCIRRLDEAAENGEFTYEYGIAKLPDINQELTTRGMSVTNALVINGYSQHKESAGLLMEYLIKDAHADLYSMTGKLSSVIRDTYENEHVAAFMENYIESVPIPKMLETSNFWVELEICFARVWGGEEANTQLRQLSEQIKTQLAGEPVAEQPIEDPQVELLPAVEYEEGTGDLDASPET
ncbi:MAG: extracellular solute-binding protein [Lachnospiraceae bacterium]|nr:extracellular solute-binding protein [Lachnospiraceae bacterium]